MKNKLEKSYNDAIYNYKSEVPDSIWENIEAILDKKKKNRRILLWCLLAVLFISGGIASWIFINSGTNNDNNKNNNVNYVASTTPLNQSNDTKSIDNIVDSEINSNTQNLNENLYSKNNTINNLETIIDNSKNHEKLNYRENYSEDNIADNTIIEETNDKNILNLSQNRSQYVYNKIDIIPFSELTTNSDLLILKNNLKHKLKYNSNKKHKKVLDDCFPTDNKLWFAEIYFTPSYPNQILSGEYTAYLKQRQNTESPLLSYSTGIRLGYMFKNASIKTGFDYTQVNEKFKITIKNVESTQTIITIDTIMNNDGTYFIRRDTTIKEIYGEEEFKKLNRYKTINVPIILGYNIKYNKHKFGINAGILMNISFKRKGYFISCSRKYCRYY
ncbi:MAG: hypothetical protein R2771_04505 [Saprospiraceae bacterium]